MSMTNIIAIAIFVAAVAIGIGIRVYQLKKKNQDITMDQFIDMYGDQIISALQDVIVILNINVTEFTDKESYNKAIISNTIEALKENASELGFNDQIVNLFDTESLTDIVYKVFTGNLIEIFSVLDSKTILTNSVLYEDKVVDNAANIADTIV